MAKIDDIKNRLDETIYPRTLTKAVYDIETNKNLDEILLEKKLKVGNTSNFSVKRQAGLKIEVSFGDPEDSIIIDKNGEQVTLAEWGGTQLRAKLNSYPVDEKDGELLEDIKVRDKYKSTPFVHEELTDGDEWYYMAFPYTKNNVFTVDSSNRGQATATKKLSQDAPSAPTVSGLKFDKATVKGASGTEVRIDSGTWYDSPHEFTGLTEETGYTAYARMKETSTKLPSESSVGKSFTTPSDMPGPSELVGGDMEAGYFGIVPAAELYTGDELAVELGITQGTSQFSDAGWLKFAIDGTIIYKSKKPFRHTISWDHIDSKGCVDGTKTVTKDGTTYKVRLMKGALTDPGNYTAGDRGAKGSEWNRLMLPISVKAKDKSWAYPAYVESTVPYWGIDFTDADLQTHNSHGNGSYQWCQEVRADSASYRFIRGYSGVSYSNSLTSSSAFADYGWSQFLKSFPRIYSLDSIT